MEQTMPETDNSLLPRGKEIDISSEIYRLYRFPRGENVTIKNPKTLVVTDNGHRIVDGRGQSHYIPYGWLHLKFKVKDGEPHFYYKTAKKTQKKEVLTEPKKEGKSE